MKICSLVAGIIASLLLLCGLCLLFAGFTAKVITPIFETGIMIFIIFICSQILLITQNRN